jgi:hypothetical protein
MPVTVYWVGHEAEAFTFTSANSTEQGNCAVAGYERTGMRVDRSGGSSIKSTPDFGPLNEFWHGWRMTGCMTTNNILWAAENAAGTVVARILWQAGNVGQFQITNGAGGFNNVGPTFPVSTATMKCDLHVKGGNPGQIEFYYGAAGSQAKVLDLAGDYSNMVNIARIVHGGGTCGGGFDNDIAMSIVQSASTLNSLSEIKPPTSNGADVDGTGTWANVDEQTYSDADQILFTAAGQHQSFKSAARTGTQAVVNGVTVSFRAWYEPGGPTKAKPYLTIGGVRYYGTTFTLDLVAKGFQYTWGTNPATGVAFTVAEANAATLEWGVEAVA